MAPQLDVCRFRAVAGGTADFQFSSAITGYQSPTAANAATGKVYRYRAESDDLTQWEVGFGVYNSVTGTFARTTVLFNSSGTTAKITFSAAPVVGIVLLAEDLREKLDADLSLYVTTNGSDSNSGRATATIGTITFTNGSANVGWTAHGRSVGDAIYLGTSGTLPTNFSAPTSTQSAIYFVKTVVDANTITLASTPTGAAITAGSAGTGTHSATLISPLATIQKAIDPAAQIDTSIYNIIVNVSAGTFTAANVMKAPIGAGTVYINGGGASATTISVTGDNCFFGSNCGVYQINSMKLTTTTSGWCIFTSGNTSNVTGNGLEVGAGASGHFRVSSGSSLRLFAYTISGGAPLHYLLEYGGRLTCVSVTVTLSGTPAFSSLFAQVTKLGLLDVEGVTWSGSATGTRYSVTTNGVLNTATGNVSILPGNAAGSTASGGQYT